MANVINKREARKKETTFKVAAGLFDFVTTIGSVFIIALCLILLTSLARWIISDAPDTFGVLYETVETAVMTEEVIAAGQGQ